MTTTLNAIPDWHFEADYVETCTCDYGCPCNFNGFPTYGFCRTLILYHIRSGSYGSTSLSSLDVVDALSWPKAIHEGNGNCQLFLTKNITEEQKNAIVSIFSGQAKGDGPFPVIDAKTFVSFVIRSMNSNPTLMLLILSSLETIPPTFSPLSFNVLATCITAVVFPIPGAPVRTIIVIVLD